MKTKNKMMYLLTLAVGISVFFIPALIYANAIESDVIASSDLTNLIVNTAWADSESLHIEVVDTNKEEQSKMEISLTDYTTDKQYLSIQAIDDSGNESNTLQIPNPHYIADETNSPLSFTPNGTGTITDNVTTDSNKEFFTIKAADDNVYYLIIDRERNSENVYFLNTVTQDDLVSLAKNDKTTGAIPTQDPSVTTSPLPDADTSPAKEKEKGRTMLLLMFAVIAIGGAGYYLIVIKSKQQDISDDSDTDYDDESEYDNYDDDFDESEDIEELEESDE